jgi:hypothetical protein
MVESQPSKLLVAGSIPVSRSMFSYTYSYPGDLVREPDGVIRVRPISKMKRTNEIFALSPSVERCDPAFWISYLKRRRVSLTRAMTRLALLRSPSQFRESAPVAGAGMLGCVSNSNLSR